MLSVRDPFDQPLSDVKISNANNEMMMGIETHSPKDDFYAILLFILVILEIAISGFFSPNHYIKHTEKLIPNQNSDNVFVNKIENINKVNKFIEYFVAIIPTTENAKFSMNYNITYDNIADNLKQQNGTIDHLILSKEDKIKYNFISQTNYLSNLAPVTFSFELSPIKEVKEIHLMKRFVNPNYAKFVVFSRLVFIVFSFITNIVFSMKFSGVSFMSMVLEQKMTFFLLVALFMYINPLFYLVNMMPSQLFDFLDNILSSTAESFFIYFIFTILSLNFNPDTFISINGLITALFYYPFTILSKFFPHNTIFAAAKVTLLIIYIIFYLVSVFTKISSIDSLEKRKTYEYCFINILFMIFILISNLSPFIPFLQETNLSYSISIASVFSFTLLMACLHWPYNSSTDLFYEAPDGENKDSQLISLQSDEDFPQEIAAEDYNSQSEENSK